jgi:antitoxin component of RelBE/YafQ-DinJ toxin-antitoxin module
VKTERLTLLINPAEKAQITARAEGLGISVSELVRRAVAGYVPEETAAREELEALLPEAEAATARILERLDRTIANVEAAEQRWTHYESDEYRHRVREEVLNDPAINWDMVRLLFGGEAKAAA